MYLSHAQNCHFVVIIFFIVELSQETGLNSDDVISTLQYYSLLKYWKGNHIILKRKVCHMTRSHDRLICMTAVPSIAVDKIVCVREREILSVFTIAQVI